MANYTRDQPKELQLPPRIPLVGVPNQRGVSSLEDSRLVNGYVEFGQDEVLRVIKRPGMDLAYDLAGYGAGMFEGYSIFFTSSGGTSSGKLYTDGVLSATFASYTTASEPDRFFSFVRAPTGLETSVIFLNNKFQCYTLSGSTVTTIPFADIAIGPLTCGITNTLTSATTADTTLIQKYATVAGTGIVVGTYVASIESATAFTLSAAATATNAAASLTFTSAGPPRRVGVVSLNDIPELVQGASVLNNAVYVFSKQNKVAGADTSDPYSWNPLNYLFAYAEQDSAVAIDHQMAYLVAFKSASTEFFRDVGNSPGSPLERVEGLQLSVGCFEGRTVQAIDGVILWCSVTESNLKSVYAMEKLRAVEIATPAIKRVLSDLMPVYAISLSWDGHSFYILTDPDAGVSLCYDLTSKFWSYWNALGETYFPFIASSVANGLVLLQHETNGNIYSLSADTFADVAVPIVMDIYPPQYDANTRLAKHIPRMHIVADQEPGSTLQVRSNDHDTTSGEWTNFREFDLSQSRPSIDNCGSFTKRFYHFRHSSPTPCRLTAVEIELLLGVL